MEEFRKIPVGFLGRTTVAILEENPRAISESTPVGKPEATPEEFLEKL